MFNPWLRTDNLPDKSGRTYYVKIPEAVYMKSSKPEKKARNFDKIFNDTLTVDELN